MRGLRSAKNPFNPILASTWVLPLNTNPSVWSPVTCGYQVPQMVPACMHRSSMFMTDSYSNFNDNCHLLETSMFSLLWLTVIVTETSCDCVAWTGSLLGALGPTITQGAAQGGPTGKACFLKAMLLTCSKEALGVTVQKYPWWVAEGF